MRYALLLVAVAGVLLAVIWATQRHLIYFPAPGPVTEGRAVLEGARDVILETSDGLRLGAWLVPTRPSGNGVTVLVANGNAGDRSLRAPLAQALARQGCGVLRSPFTDLAAVGRVHYPYLPVGLLLRDRYPVIEHIRRVDVPTTVVYGTNDTIVPPEQSRAVARAAAGPTTTVAIEGADHNDLSLLDGAELIDAIVGLVDRIQRAGGPQQGSSEAP